MSRFDTENWGDYPELDSGRWFHNLAAALKGKRGQAALRDLVAALDALSEKRLIKGAICERLYSDDGATLEKVEVCAIGAFALYKGASPDKLPYDDDEGGMVTADLGVAHGLVHTLAWEIGYLNDDTFGVYTPEERWQKVRDWAESHLQSALT